MASQSTKLREALSDSADNPRFTETLARRGYRFIAPVLPGIPAAAVSVVLATGPAGPPEQVSLSAREGHCPAWLTGTTLFACIAIGFLLVAVRQQPRGSTGRISRITYSGRILNSKLDLDRVSTVLTDGSRLFFSQVEGGRTVLAEASIANGEVLNMKLPSEIDSPILLAISPDRSSLLVHNTLTSDPEPPLWIVPALGSNAQRIPNLLAHDATWMPEGKRILYATRTSLFIIRSDGTDNEKFADVPGWAFWLRSSPDNKRFAIMAEEPGKPWRIYLEDAVGGSLTPLIEDAQNQSDPNWSADGETLVFGQAPQTMTTEHEAAGIYEVDLAGHHITEIPGSTGLFSPRLSHDGRYIVAIDITSRYLMLFDRQTPAWRRPSTHEVSDPFWTSDGKYVYFEAEREPGQPIYRIEVATGRLELISSLDSLHLIEDLRELGIQRTPLRGEFSRLLYGVCRKSACTGEKR